MTAPEKPVPATILVFYCIIIPVLTILQPPFLLYSFRSISSHDLVQLSFVPEKQGWIIGNGCHHRDGFGWLHQLQGSWAIQAPFGDQAFG